MARPQKYATASERQAAYRARYEVIEIRVVKETGETLTALAQHLDVPRTELVNSLINFALLNRNWATLGLFGKRLPYSKNPIMEPLYETAHFWVRDAGSKGFEVYRNGATASTKVASIGHGPAPNLGLARAIAEANRREEILKGK